MAVEFARELTLVLVNYHSGDPLERFVASYRQNPILASHEVIVVDNAGDDGVAEWIVREVPQFRVLDMGANAGYAGAVNAAIDTAQGRHILVVNPDVELVPRCVDDALRHLDDNPEAGMVGVRLVDADGTPQHNARRFYTLTSIALRRTPLGRWMPNHPEMRRHLMLDDDFTGPGPVDWITGAFMLVRREALDRVGPMDARFFLYFEDVDWCARMWERGWEVHLLPQIQLVHEYRRTSLKLSKSLVYHLRSFFSFYGKWGVLSYVARRLRPAWSTAAAVVGDVLALNLAFFAAFLARRLLDPIFPQPLFDLVDYMPLLLSVNLASLVVLPLVGRYRQREAGVEATAAGLEAVRAAFFVTLLVMAGTYLAHTRTFSRAVLLLFVPLYLGALGLTGWMRTRLLAGGATGRGRRALAVGGGEDFADWLRGIRAAGLEQPLAGAVTDGAPSEGVRLLGTLDHLEDVVDRYRITDVLLDGRLDVSSRLLSTTRDLAYGGVEVLVDEHWAAALSGSEQRVQRWGRQWWRMKVPAALSSGAALKLLLDPTVAVLLSVVALPGFLLCSILGRPIGIVRARSLQRLGRRQRAIRWTELVDRGGRPLPGIVQLPRFLQILVGHMSLVGPYPFAQGCEQELEPTDQLRFALKPGLAGTWQSPSEEEGLRSYLHGDGDYLERWSFALEMDILLRWLPRLFRRDERFVAGPDLGAPQRNMS